VVFVPARGKGSCVGPQPGGRGPALSTLCKSTLKIPNLKILTFEKLKVTDAFGVSGFQK
jgi:hypothetical protein